MKHFTHKTLKKTVGFKIGTNCGLQKYSENTELGKYDPPVVNVSSK